MLQCCNSWHMLVNRHHEVRGTLAFKPHASRRTLRTSSLRLGPAAVHWCNSENTPGLWDQAITIMVPGSEWSPDKKETILVKASEFKQLSLSLCISLGLPCVEKDATIQQRAWWYRRVYLTSGPSTQARVTELHGQITATQRARNASLTLLCITPLWVIIIHVLESRTESILGRSQQQQEMYKPRNWHTRFGKILVNYR